ncbi:hypothetical protein HL667_07090 [Bradyrhizobium sp. 83012]|uniref:Uncharacterized protein n=1 Tax=Bradyrhizobium aeschynomenes TaxID=2734909 RepID=A0ABX2C927_9BRAD|nr:hypothetical protein [Bradyrhizobium aeschynomenes]NPU64751.1 hypothetical protein [Bradyrhizobium aeschynomenes]NPV24482.1 hypothetical protein [Bradyrhizobium aeschynomenes]
MNALSSGKIEEFREPAGRSVLASASLPIPRKPYDEKVKFRQRISIFRH